MTTRKVTTRKVTTQRASRGGVRPSRTVWGVALAVAVAVAGCGGSDPEPQESSADETPVTAGPAPPPPPPPPPPTSLLTGLPGVDGPALAVKIDNTSDARPRIGLASADLVYVEPVEGGLTRLLAVFCTQMPSEVGPVRSARESDGRILDGWTGVAFADSGASRVTNSELRAADFERVSNDTSGEGYRRDRSRRAPYNVIGDTSELVARAGGSATPPDVGFRFGATPAGGTSAKSVDVKYRASRIGFGWSRSEKRWLLTTDGRPDVAPDGTRHGAATVVVQTVNVVASRQRDVNGSPSPLVTVTGSGTATVLRDGQSFAAGWSRPTEGAVTTFTTGSRTARTPLTFAPGPVWVVLVSSRETVRVS